jgi:hypothetical protein
MSPNDFGVKRPEKWEDRYVARKWTPMRWPAGWSDLSALADTPIDYVLVDEPDTLRRLAADATARSLSIGFGIHPPSGVELVDGAWGGSNGWRVSLASARHPDAEVWVEASPAAPRLSPEHYLAALADAAANDGRWIIRLDDRLAAGVSAKNPASLGAWKRLSDAARFFADWRWSDFAPVASIGALSGFAGDNEYLGRVNQPCRFIPVARFSPASFAGLKAVLYPDREPPSAPIRAAVMKFAEQGGLVVAGDQWGAPPTRSEEHPRYVVGRIGKGRIAVAKQAEENPSRLLEDAIVLLSHRHDLVRLWNAAAARATLSASPDRRRALLQLVSYARVGDVSVWIAGPYRRAQLFTPDSAAPIDLPAARQNDGVEIRLPAIGPYVAIQLTVGI